MASNMGLPRGFRFRPSKKELIRDWLMPKNMGYNSHVDPFIAMVDLYNCEPWDLPHKSKIPDDKKWLFLCRRDQLQGKGTRFKRKTKRGFWKSTCEALPIMDEKTKECIATRRILVFHAGPSPGKRTDWVLHEYAPYKRLPNQIADYVICCLKKKKKKTVKTKKANKEDVNIAESLEGESNGIFVSDLEIPLDPAAVMQEFDRAEGNHGWFSKLNLPFVVDGEPSCNFTSNNEVSPTATSMVEDHAEDSASFVQPLHSPEDHNEMAASCTFAEPEMSVEELLNMCFPHDDGYGEATDSVLGDASQPASLKMPYMQDGPVNSNMDADGVDGWENFFHLSQPHLPYLDEVEPCCNVTSNSEVPPITISVMGGHAKDSELFTQPLHSPEGHNVMASSCRFAESEVAIEELLNMSSPCEDESAIDCILGDASQSASLKMSHFLNGPVSSNMDVKGVDGGEKVFHLLQPHLPYLHEGKPSCNVTSNSEVPPTTTSMIGDHAKASELFTQPLHSPEGHNEIAASCRFAESEVSIEELLNMFFPHEDEYGEAVECIFGDASQPAAVETPYFPDGPVSTNMDARGVDGQEKVIHSLAYGE